MRIWVILLIAGIIGCTAGISLGRYEFSGVTEYFEPMSRAPAVVVDTPTGTVPKGARAVIVGGSEFDFGTMAFGSSATKAFEVQNAGSDPLELTFGKASCGMCIEVDEPYHHILVPPGESRDLVIRYSAKKEGPPFHETAYYSSNDPLLDVVRLDIKGVVTKPLRLMPPDIALGNVSSSEGMNTQLILLGYRNDDVQFLELEFSNPSFSEFLDIKTERLPAASVKKADRHATNGLLLNVTVKPGLPLGALRESITLRALSDGPQHVDVEVTGDVVGDITLIGKNFNSEQNHLMIGVVKQGEGRESTLYVLVKGPYRENVKLSIGEIDPPGVIQARVGDGTPIADGKAIKFPLTVEIPKDAERINLIGSAQSKMGKVVLETTHPVTQRIPIRVRVAVE